MYKTSGYTKPVIVFSCLIFIWNLSVIEPSQNWSVRNVSQRRQILGDRCEYSHWPMWHFCFKRYIGVSCEYNHWPCDISTLQRYIQPLSSPPRSQLFTSALSWHHLVWKWEKLACAGTPAQNSRARSNVLENSTNHRQLPTNRGEFDIWQAPISGIHGKECFQMILIGKYKAEETCECKAFEDEWGYGGKEWVYLFWMWNYLEVGGSGH